MRFRYDWGNLWKKYIFFTPSLFNHLVLKRFSNYGMFTFSAIVKVESKFLYLFTCFYFYYRLLKIDFAYSFGSFVSFINGFWFNFYIIFPFQTTKQEFTKDKIFFATVIQEKKKSWKGWKYLLLCIISWKCILCLNERGMEVFERKKNLV